MTISGPESIARGFVLCFDEYASNRTFQGNSVLNFPASVQIASNYVDGHQGEIDAETVEALSGSIAKAQAKFEEVIVPQNKQNPQPELPSFPQSQWVELVRPSRLRPTKLIGGVIQAVIGNYIISWLTRGWVAYNPTRSVCLFAAQTAALTAWDYFQGPDLISGRLEPQNNEEGKYLAPLLNGPTSIATQSKKEIGVLASLKQDQQTISFPFSVKVDENGKPAYQWPNIEIDNLDLNRPVNYQLRVFQKV